MNAVTALRLVSFVMSTAPAPFDCQALDTARLLRRLSWSELADAALVSRAALSKIRNGTVPSDETVAAFAEALDFPLGYFYQQPPASPSEGVLHYRKKARAPQKRISQLMASATVLNKLVEHLAAHHAEYGSIRKGTTRSGAFNNRLKHVHTEDIEFAAQQCRRKWGIKLHAPIAHACAAIERAGAVTATFDAEDIAVDAFSWCHRTTDEQIPLIMFSRQSAPSRVRFSLLHETGHLVLHQQGCGALGTEGDEQREREANRFAAAMLLPAEPFRAQFPIHNERLDWDALLDMKRVWGASLQAIIYRAHQLDVIGAATYRWAFVHINQRGWKRLEPGEPSEAESPQALTNLVAQYLQQTHSDLPQLADQLTLPLDIVEQLMTV